MRFDSRAGRELAIKDCSQATWLMRVLFCRPALRREARTYAALAGVEGVPESFGLESRDRLVLARAPGQPLPMGPETGLPPSAVDNLERVLERIHGRGVAIADLHRSNVLVAEDGSIHVIDYALARIARDPERPGPLVRWLQTLDRHALARIRARLEGQPEPRPRGIFGAIYRFGRAFKRLI